jgi:hypothetical protein
MYTGPGMAEYQRREAARVMGYQFGEPSRRGLVVRAPTPEERQAKDKRIELLREEQGAEEALRVTRARQVAAYQARFADARTRAIAALARYAKTRK